MKLARYTTDPSLIQLPYYSIPIPCGPGVSIEQLPAEMLRLSEYLGLDNGPANFYRGYGDSMEDSHISDGDLLVTQRAETARAGDVVVACIDGEYTVKRLKQHSHGLYLVPANDNYPIRKVHRHESFEVHAVVTHVIHKFSRFV